MPNALLLLLSLFLITSNCLAAPTLKDYGSLPSVSEMAVAPDGNTIAFRRVQDGRDILNVVSISEKRALPGVDLAEIQPKSILFLNNDNIYLQASTFGRVEGFRGKFETSTGFAFNLRSNKVRQLLIPGEDAIYPGQTGLGEIVGFTQDRNYVLMPAFVGSTDLVLGKPLDPDYSLLKVRIEKKGRPKRITSGTPYTTDFFIDGEGRFVAEERYDQRRNLHSIWAMKNGKLQEIFSENVEIRNKAWVGVTEDGTSIVFLETNEQTGRSDYYLLDIASGKISKSDLGRNDADIESVIFGANRTVVGVRFSGFSPSYKFFDPQLDKRIQTISAKFPEQSVWITDQSPDWRHIIIYVAGSNFAGDYYLATDEKTPIFIAASRPSIGETDINPIGKINLTARDGLAIPTLLTIPRASLSNMKNLPAVIFPHGGPRSYDRIEFDYFSQALASEGYMVVQPQFRGSSGFGEKHAVAGNGEWGRKMQDDITDAVKALGQKGIINSEKVCIVGMSYGGYAALAGGAFTPDLYKCVVSINGVTNLPDLYQYDKYEHGHNHSVVSYMEMQFAANADGKVDKAEMKKRSPEYHADSFMAPVLLIHAENDKIVPFRQSASMKSALSKKKKQVELVELKGDSHHLENNDTRLSALEHTARFVNTYLKN